MGGGGGGGGVGVGEEDGGIGGVDVHVLAETYMEHHRIMPLLKALTTQLVVHRPENPVAFMRAHLASVAGDVYSSHASTQTDAPLPSQTQGPQSKPEPSPKKGPSGIELHPSDDSSDDGSSSDFSSDDSMVDQGEHPFDDSVSALSEAERKARVDRILGEDADVRSFRKEQITSIRSRKVGKRPRAVSSVSVRPSSASRVMGGGDGDSEPLGSPAASRLASSSESVDVAGARGHHSVKETIGVRTSGDAEGDILINQFQVMELLGKGAYGEVYRVIDTEDPFHHQFAMKVLRSAKMKKTLTRPRPGVKPKRQGPDPAGNPMHELAVMKKLNHPNVVKLKEVITDTSVANKMYFVMEYLPFGTVMEGCIAGEGLEIEATYVYLRDIIYGLEYLHHQNVIHRDLKPENLLIDAQGVIKITDFGVSHVFEGTDDSLSSTLGTPAYYAPELCTRGQEVEGRAVDVWALGVCLYEFLFGRLPFVPPKRTNPFAVQRALFEMIRKDDIVVPDDVEIDEDLTHLLFRLLEKDPHKRITIPQLKVDKWLCQDGEHPMLDQSLGSISVSQREVDSAITSGMATMSHVLFAASRWRRRSRISSAMARAAASALASSPLSKEATEDGGGGDGGDGGGGGGGDGDDGVVVGVGEGGERKTKSVLPVGKTPSPPRKLVLDKDMLDSLSEISAVEQIIRTSGSSTGLPADEDGDGWRRGHTRSASSTTSLNLNPHRNIRSPRSPSSPGSGGGGTSPRFTVNVQGEGEERGRVSASISSMSSSVSSTSSSSSSPGFSSGEDDE